MHPNDSFICSCSQRRILHWATFKWQGNSINKPVANVDDWDLTTEDDIHWATYPFPLLPLPHPTSSPLPLPPTLNPTSHLLPPIFHLPLHIHLLPPPISHPPPTGPPSSLGNLQLTKGNSWYPDFRRRYDRWACPGLTSRFWWTTWLVYNCKKSIFHYFNHLYFRYSRLYRSHCWREWGTHLELIEKAWNW